MTDSNPEEDAEAAARRQENIANGNGEEVAGGGYGGPGPENEGAGTDGASNDAASKDRPSDGPGNSSL